MDSPTQQGQISSSPTHNVVRRECTGVRSVTVTGVGHLVTSMLLSTTVLVLLACPHRTLPTPRLRGTRYRTSPVQLTVDLAVPLSGQNLTTPTLLSHLCCHWDN
ncbi:uncharacterized protein LOC110441604 [Mizuhopecten yessoensis]|uniref:uncharacterized protein LOC110441604 n=1 Tax=Mizuhopecten yessoensis TaxID=6573 RepID=UPI000B45A249|nr:uncharacterized protein LOC110441604 [Mizuhopecten yessoensis]